jgi:histidine ammonia-lyase
VAAAQALEQHAPLAPGAGTAAALEAIRRHVQRLDGDRSLAPDIERLAAPATLEAIVAAAAAASDVRFETAV